MSPEAIAQLTKAGWAGATAFAVVFFLSPLVRAMSVRFSWVARPVEDRWGRRIVARLGGVAMFAGFLAAALWWLPLERTLTGVLVGSCLVFVLGLVDDLRRLPPYTKLVGQLLVGCIVVMSGLRVELIAWTWLSVPLSVLWFVLMMNAFNLLDNMDGLAAGVGAIAAAVCALHAAMAQQWLIVSLSAIICGTCLGFLRFNMPPAKIYMGDSGSHFLGLSLGAVALLGSWQHSTQLFSVLAIPVLILAVPIFDTCFVMIQRLLHRQHPFVGGRDHLSHRLAILGLTTRQSVVTLYGISASLGLLSVVSPTMKPVTAGVVWAIVLAALILFGRYLGQVNVYRIEPVPMRQPTVKPAGNSTLVETMLLHKRRLAEILVDFALICSAYLAAYLLRFEGVLTAEFQNRIIQSLPVLLVIKLSCFAGCGLYRGVWRYMGLADAMAVFRAVTLGSVLSALAFLFLWRFEGYSRAVLVIDWLLMLLAIGGSRVVERLLDEWISGVAARGVPTLILGAGDTGARVLRSLKYEVRGQQRVVGFLDDNMHKQGNRIHGVPVLGGRSRLEEMLKTYHGLQVLVAINDPPGELLHYIQQLCEPRGVTWKVVTAGVTDAV